MPLEISPLPLQPPFVGRPNTLEFGNRRIGSFISVIPSRAPLDNHHLMTFDRILKPYLVFEMGRTSFLTEPANGLLDALEFEFTEGHQGSFISSRRFHRSEI